MFDLKKRHSMVLKVASHETEVFRRVALRRRSNVAVDDHASHTVPPKPPHLQTPERGSQHKDLAPRNLKPTRVSSPVASQCPTGGANSPRAQVAVLIRVIPARLPLPSRSPAESVNNSPIRLVRRSDGTTLLEAPSPALRGHNGSPLRGGGGPGGHSDPASLPSRDIVHKQAKHRTPSPLVRARSHRLFRRSRSWVGLRKAAGCRVEELAGHGSAVPQLGVHLDGSSPTGDASERAPLTALPSASCAPSRSPACRRTYHSASATDLSLASQGLSTEPGPGPVAAGPGPWAGASLELTHHGGEAQGTSGAGASRRSASEKDVTKDVTTLKEARTHEDVAQYMDVEKGVEERDNGGGPKRKEKLHKIATELLMTERAYVARLHLLDQVFCSRLSEEASRGLFPVEVVKNIFSNISSIHSFHSQFLLPDLEERMMHWWGQPGLGDILLRHAPFLRMYAEYVGNFEQAAELLRSWRERSAAFRSILQDIQSQEVCGSLSLEHHMLEPVQRVPRYEMLLRGYLRKLPEEDPDHPLAQKALEAISMAAGHCNSAIHRAETMKRLLEIFEMVGEEEVLNPSSEFLREGRLLKLAARNTSAMERYLFLFNNFLLCCAPRVSMGGPRYGVRARLGVGGMQVQRTTNEGHPHSFQISGKEKTLELEASSEKDRDEWIKVIQEAIDVFHEKNDTFKLASKEFDVTVPEEALGRRAPRWTRDHEVVVCMKCQEPFNAITRRRHHCRACGCVVCWKCSDHKVALEYDGNRLNKVCRACYGVLSGSRPTGTNKHSRQDTVKLATASRDAVMSSFLIYGSNPKACRRVWSVIPQGQPVALHLCSDPQESGPQWIIPLLGSSVEESPRLPSELQDPWRFCLVHSSSRHTFLCHSLELKQRWLAALRRAGAAGLPAGQ